MHTDEVRAYARDIESRLEALKGLRVAVTEVIHGTRDLLPQDHVDSPRLAGSKRTRNEDEIASLSTSLDTLEEEVCILRPYTNANKANTTHLYV